MTWLFVFAVTLASGFGGLSDVRAADPAKERSIDDLTVTAEIARDGDLMAYGFDALWMMTGPIIVRVDGTTNAVGDHRTRAGLGDWRGRRVDPGCGVGADLQVRPS
jgi:hypothetical protein